MILSVIFLNDNLNGCFCYCRCILDTMRLVDLLLVLLFEGRKALPKPGVASARLASLRRQDASGEKTHRQLIDCIRSKDTEALIEGNHG